MSLVRLCTRSMWAVLAVAALFVIYLTNSRGPMLAIAAGGAVVLLSGVRIPRRVLIPGVLVALAGIAAFVDHQPVSRRINPLLPRHRCCPLP